MRLSKSLGDGAWRKIRRSFLSRRDRRGSDRRFRLGPLERFEERVNPSPMPPYIFTNIGPQLDGHSLTSSTGIQGVATGLDQLEWHQTGPLTFTASFVNNTGKSATLDVGVYKTQGTMQPVDLTSEVLVGFEEFTLTNSSSPQQIILDLTKLQDFSGNPVSLSSSDCLQFDAIIKSATIFVNGVTETISGKLASYNTPGDNLQPGPEYDAGDNVYGFVNNNPGPGVHNTGDDFHFGDATPSPTPTDIQGTLIAAAQTAGSCATPQIAKGDTATIGFWQIHNKNGNFIISNFGSTADGHTVGEWLASSFPEIFASNSPVFSMPAAKDSAAVKYSDFVSSNTGTSDKAVLDLYDNIFANGGSPKVLSEFFDLALATFTTSTDLNTNPVDQAYATNQGFNVTVGGIGLADVDIGTAGQTALSAGLFDTIGGVQHTIMGMGTDGTVYSVLSILHAVDNLFTVDNGVLSSDVDSLLDTINSNNDIG
jgi:hypothetical protein